VDQEIRMRLRWIELYEKTGNAGLTCLRCGISRPTLREWWKRYQAKGLEGLKALSRRPRSSPKQDEIPFYFNNHSLL
jgi:transposase-like protein